MDKLHTYQVSVTLNAEGDQAHGIVFREPTQGYSFKRGDLLVVDEHGAYTIANDEGVIPHRERTQGEGEDLGLTWQFAK